MNLSQYCKSRKNNCCPTQALEELLRNLVPLARHLDIRISYYDGDCLRIRAPFAPNVNGHGTAFAGSIGAVFMLTGWGLIQLKLYESIDIKQIALVNSSIDFHRPLLDSIEVNCGLGTNTDPQRVKRMLSRRGIASVQISGHAFCGADKAASYSGRYCVRASVCNKRAE